MTRQSFLACTLLVGLAALALPAPPAGAHPDDPKYLDFEPPYQGPGWRRLAWLNGGNGPLEHDFPNEDVTLWAWLPLDELGFAGTLDSANDCWGYVSPDRREYALVGTSHGTAIVDVTIPELSQVVEFVDGPRSTWRDIKTYLHYAYAVSEGGGGIQVIDLGRVDEGIVTLVGSVTDGGTAKTHNVAINEDSGYLYRAGGDNNGLRIYSLADPASPELVATWPDRYVHDVQVVTFQKGRWAGREIAFACAGFNGGWVETGLDVIDVTDKDDIRTLARLVYPDGEYSHQVWVDVEHGVAYLNDELDEQEQNVTTRTRLIDVSNLHQPELVTTFSTGTNAIDHNLYVHDGKIFQSNYRSGLRVFDASDPRNPVPAGWFDTYPPNDANRFNGLWSNYPFFPSGTVIGSDIEKGLFVWTLGPPPDGNRFDPPAEREPLPGRDELRLEPGASRELGAPARR